MRLQRRQQLADFRSGSVVADDQAPNRAIDRTSLECWAQRGGDEGLDRLEPGH